MFQNTGSSLVCVVILFVMLCPDSSWKLSCESGFWCKLYGALLPLQVTVMTQPRFHFQCLRILSNASSN